MRHMGHVKKLSFAAVCGLAVFLLNAPLFAQQSNHSLSRDIQSLSDSVERLERSLKDVEREVYSQKRRSLKSTGPSGQDAGSADQSAQYTVRIDELESIIRELNGELEQLRFVTEQLTQRQENLSGDLEFRLQAIEQKLGLSLTGAGGSYTPQSAPQPGPTAAPVEETQPSPPTTIGSSVDPEAVPTVQGLGQAEEVVIGERTETSTVTPSTPGAGTQTLGTIPADQLPGSSSELYSHARDKILQRDFAGAQQALEKFIADHGDDDLAGAAQYWLGESFYAQGAYKESGQAFAKVLADYPNSEKAPDSLLKLGMSFSNLGETKAACNSFKEMSRRFPNASNVITQRLDVEKSKAGC